MRTLGTALGLGLIAALAVGSVAAQPHPGGFLLGAGTYQQSQWTDGLVRVDRSGVMTTAVDLTVNNVQPGLIQAATMAFDNRKIVFGCDKTNTFYTLRHGLFTVDPANHTFQTIVSGSAFAQVYGIAVDQDGDYIVNASGVSGSSFESRIYRVTQSGAVSTMLTTQQLGARVNFTKRIRIHPATGDVLIPVNGTLNGTTHPVLALSRDGTVSTWHASTSGFTPTNDFVLRIADNALYSFFNGRTQRVTTSSAPAVLTNITNNNGYAVDMIEIENQSTPNAQLIGYMGQSATNGTYAAIAFIDPATNAVTNTIPFIQASNFVRRPYPGYDMALEHTRYLQTEKTGTRKWKIHVNLPTFANKGYVIAASMSGIRPGVKLLDGRKIWLNPDDLFLVTVRNQLFPFFNPGPLVLDANGRAQGSLDFSFLPPQVSIRFHMALGVIDPQAPTGLAFITEPVPHIL